MKSIKEKSIEFTYLKKSFNTVVQQVCYPNGYTLFKINFGAGRYWFINFNNQWQVVASFQPCRKLKEVITEHLQLLLKQTTTTEDMLNVIQLKINGRRK